MNKSYVLSSLRINKGQWNSGFDMLARRDSEGDIFATDKARKYSIRKELEINGNNILIKKHQSDEDISKVKSLTNILKNEGCLKKGKSLEELRFLYRKFIDLRTFGFILNPSKDFNFNSHGSFQIYYANDIYANYTEDMIVDITSYKSSTEKDANSTIGKQVLVDVGFLNYTMCIQPNIYMKEAKNILGETFVKEESEKQFEEDKNEFITSINNDVSNMQSCSKNGVENFYNIVINMVDENKSLDVHSLQNISVSYSNKEIKVNLDNTLNVIKLNKENIKNIEFYSYESAVNVDFLNFEKELKENSIELIKKDMLS